MASLFFGMGIEKMRKGKQKSDSETWLIRRSVDTQSCYQGPIMLKENVLALSTGSFPQSSRASTVPALWLGAQPLSSSSLVYPSLSWSLLTVLALWRGKTIRIIIIIRRLIHFPEIFTLLISRLIVSKPVSSWNKHVTTTLICFLSL